MLCLCQCFHKLLINILSSPFDWRTREDHGEWDGVKPDPGDWMAEGLNLVAGRLASPSTFNITKLPIIYNF